MRSRDRGCCSTTTSPSTSTWRRSRRSCSERDRRAGAVTTQRSRVPPGPAAMSDRDGSQEAGPDVLSERTAMTIVDLREQREARRRAKLGKWEAEMDRRPAPARERRHIASTSGLGGDASDPRGGDARPVRAAAADLVAYARKLAR